ncbi:MAG: helix-turn-helix transcriptional regulator [Polynucleobacter sp.]|nr:helix-turn-helix transcriptional regulator [Polynucleobacter sp.]MBJ7503910.1 helix-turn-helix transcriptional regulator [Polynucleobacter sp.]
MKPQNAPIKTYRMSERSPNLDFDIRDWTVRPPIVTPHRHEFFQIHINVNGGSKHGIKNTIATYPDQSLIFILPYRMHFSQPAPNPNYYIINFSNRFLGTPLTSDLFELEDLSPSDYPEIMPFLFQGMIDFNFNKKEFAYILDLIEKMLLLNSERKVGALQRIKGALLELIGFTCDKHHQAILKLTEGQLNLNSTSSSFKRVLKFIDKNINKDIGLNDVAEATFLSPNYLSQLLKEKTGLAFVGWLTLKRMERAQELLTMTNNRISSIADEVGFKDEAYFTRRFRQRFGKSPSEYRASKR